MEESENGRSLFEMKNSDSKQWTVIRSNINIKYNHDLQKMKMLVRF